MADIFGNSGGLRGCFTHVRLEDAGSSRGAQLILPDEVKLPTDELTDPLLCVGFESSFSETVLFNKCFGNRVYTYAFGHDPYRSSFSVNLLGFLVDKDKYSEVVDDVFNAYRDARVSSAQSYALLALGDSRPVYGFVVGVSSHTVDPKHSLQMFRMQIAVPGV